MAALLKTYNAKKEKSLEYIIDLHCQFERIHPFQDGNCRVKDPVHLLLFHPLPPQTLGRSSGDSVRH